MLTGESINVQDIGYILKLASYSVRDLNITLAEKARVASKITDYVIDNTDTRFMPDSIADPAMKAIINSFILLFIEY